MRIENTCASQPLSGITTISAIRYDVEIQPPSSVPAPIAPWMSASDALTIWMLSTAMKAPSVEPTTAHHMRIGLIAVAALGVAAVRGALLVFAAIWSVAMTFLLPAVRKHSHDGGQVIIRKRME